MTTEDLGLTHGDGRFSKLMAGFAKTDLMIVDDWGLAKFAAGQRRDLLERLDHRHGIRSTVVTSQVPVDHWDEVIGDHTLADAILDRLVHSAYRIHLTRRVHEKTSREIDAHRRRGVTR